MHRLVLVIIVVSSAGVGAYLAFRATDVIEVKSDEVVLNSEPTKEAPPKPPQFISDWQAPKLMAGTYQSEHGPLPASLKGTQIPFDLEVDAKNHLILSSNLRHMFDYFFTLVGEEDVSLVIQRVEELLNNHLPNPASEQARDIYQQYIEVKKGEMVLSQQLITDPQTRVAKLKDMRQSILSAEVYEAFYGMEDHRAEYSLARHEILSDQSLSELDKKASIEQLDRQVPEHMRPVKAEQPKLSQDLLQVIQKSKANNVSEATFQQGLPN